MEGINIATTGRGIWFITHLKAAKSDTPRKIKETVDFLYFLAEHLPCDRCRHHLSKFLEQTVDTRKEINSAGKMLKYTWYLHNIVNRVLRKPCVDFEPVYNFYMSMNQEDCQDFCVA